MKKLKQYTITLREESMEIVGDFAKMYGVSPDEIIQECIDERLGEVDEDGKDPLFEEAVEIIMSHKEISASFLQRKLVLGFNRASVLLKQLEEAGYVAKVEGNHQRKVIRGN